MIFPGSKAAIFAALLFAAITPAAGQDLSAWFDHAPEAAAYASGRHAAEALAAKVRAAGLADRLLVDRIVEGVRKRVPPDRLIAAMVDETTRLESISRLLAERSLLPADPSEAAGFAAEASLLMRAGATTAEFEAALDAAAKLETQGKPGSSQGIRVERALSAIATVRAINARFPLDEADRSSLCFALVGSVLDSGRFDSLVSVFAKYRAIGLPAQRIASIVAKVCVEGGSLELIERELQRRIRTP